MRALDSAITAQLAGAGVDVHVLVWVTARDRTTGEPVTLGFWTGADHQVITVGGVARTYYGVGALLDHDPVTSLSAAQNKVWTLTVSPLHEQIVEAVRTYEARLGAVEVHEWHFDTDTHLPLAEPVRVVRGTIHEVDLPTPAEGEASTATISVVTDAWRLTRGLTLKRSQEALSARAPGDALRRYNTVTGVQTAWGEALASSTGSSIDTLSKGGTTSGLGNQR